MYLYTVHTGFVCLGWETLFILPSRNLSLYSFDMLHHRFVFLLVCMCVSSLSLLDILLWPAFCLVFYYLIQRWTNGTHVTTLLSFVSYYSIFRVVHFCFLFTKRKPLSVQHRKRKDISGSVVWWIGQRWKMRTSWFMWISFSPFLPRRAYALFFPRLIYTDPFSLHFLLLFWIDKILLQWKCDKFEGEKFNRS